MKCFYVEGRYPNGDRGWSELVDVADALALVTFFRQVLRGNAVLREFSRTRQREVDAAFAAAPTDQRAQVVLARGGCECGKCRPPSSCTPIGIVRIPAAPALVTSQQQLAAALGCPPQAIVELPSASSAKSAVETPEGATADDAGKKQPSLLAAVLDKAAAFALALLGTPQPRKDAP